MSNNSIPNSYIILSKHEDNKFYPLSNSVLGTYILPSELNSIILDLIEYSENYSDKEIININKNIECESFKPNFISKKEKIKKRCSGYVYILKCENKYKIGFSKNVKRRIAQLDIRPFKLELIYLIYSDYAYQIEQELHIRLNKYKDTGEWYRDFSSDIDIKTFVSTVAEELRCDIQY